MNRLTECSRRVNLVANWDLLLYDLRQLQQQENLTDEEMARHLHISLDDWLNIYFHQAIFDSYVSNNKFWDAIKTYTGIERGIIHMRQTQQQLTFDK